QEQDVQESVTDSSEEPADNSSESLAQADIASVADASLSVQKPRYETIFQTARRLAEERALGVPIPTTLEPNPYIVSSMASKQKERGAKGKELDLGFVPKIANSVSAHEAIIKAASAGSENENSDDDIDFEPNTSEDDDEEEILQESMEPIDEQEEVTTSPGDVDSSAAFSETNEGSVAQQDTEEDQSIEVSVIEESESESEPGSEVDVAVDSERASVSDAHQEPSVDVEDEEEDVEDEYEYDGNDSDQVTEEIASMGSDSESVQVEDDHKREHVHKAAAHRIEDTLSFSPSRSWWPFSASALFGEKKENLPNNPEEQEGQEEEDLDADSENHSVDLNRGVAESPLSSKSVATVGVQTPPSLAQTRPFVPLSFIDISASGKRFSKICSSRRRASELPNSLSQPLETSMPLDQQPKQQLHNTDKQMQKQKGTRKKEDIALQKPLITAHSLGIESKRSSKQSDALQKPRKRPMLYYGAGYGSRSVPYTINLSHSAPSGPMFAKQSEKTLLPSTESQKKGGSSSITARKILDIIGEVPPPTRSQSNADLQDVINPYELSSPYSVRMRPKTVQQRRVLVPLSARLAQASAPQASPAKQRAEAAAASTKSLMQSIQSAAPPEIKAAIGSAQKPVIPKALPKADEVSPKKAESNKRETKAIKIQSLFANAPDASTASSKPAPVFSSSAPISKSSLSKQTVDGEPNPVKAQPSSIVEPVVTPARTARAIALALSETQLPSFAFELPTTKPGLSVSFPGSVNQAVISLNVSQLPAFAFSIETSNTVPFLPNTSGGLKTQSLAPGEWKCDHCDLRNSGTVKECRVCEAPKPAWKPLLKADDGGSKTATSSWADSGFKMPALKDGEWKCSVCDITNPKSACQCRACESPKPVHKLSANTAAPVPAPVQNLWANSGFKMPALKDGEWK
ncbi:hypothetical protein FB639_003693, partial [Coemansia asiatica]